MSKIGVGVTTFNRPEHIDLFMSHYEKHNDGTKIYIADDTNHKKGVAYRKNECLYALQDCDYVFLFDDDVVILKDGWSDHYINASIKSGQNHLMYLTSTPTLKLIGENPPIEIYDNCAGCLMFMTKKVIDMVGGYNKAYGRYGWEHVSYSNRVHNAGLNPIGLFTSPQNASEYIYSMDLQNNLSFNKDVRHKPSMHKEIKDIQRFISSNYSIYLMDRQIYQPL